MSDPIEQAIDDAPGDVEATLRWLVGIGFTRTATWYSESAFGNLALTFTRDDDEIRVTRDRGQWALDVRRSGWSEFFDLDIILDQINDGDDSSRRSDALPAQLPPGVVWSEAVPEAWSWAERTADAEALLRRTLGQRAQRRRSTSEPRARP